MLIFITYVDIHQTGRDGAPGARGALGERGPTGANGDSGDQVVYLFMQTLPDIIHTDYRCLKIISK